MSSHAYSRASFCINVSPHACRARDFTPLGLVNDRLSVPNMPAFSQLRNPSADPSMYHSSRSRHGVGLETAHARVDLAEPFHSTLRRPHRRLLPTCALRNNLRYECPYVSGVDTNAHIAPRLAFHGALSTSTILVNLSRALCQYTCALSQFRHALRPAPGNPCPATCVASCAQASYEMGDGSRGAGTGDFCSYSRCGGQWRR